MRDRKRTTRALRIRPQAVIDVIAFAIARKVCDIKNVDRYQRFARRVGGAEILSFLARTRSRSPDAYRDAITSALEAREEAYAN